MTREETEALFARVADLLRRGGTEDAERLVRELEAALLPKVAEQIVMFLAEIPAGDYPADARLLQFFHPKYSAVFTHVGIFPWRFEASAARVQIGFEEQIGPGGFTITVDRAAILDSLHLRERANGVEVARYPVDAFTAPWEAQFARVYDPHEVYELELCTREPLRLVRPGSVTLMLGGRRGTPPRYDR